MCMCTCMCRACGMYSVCMRMLSSSRVRLGSFSRTCPDLIPISSDLPVLSVRHVCCPLPGGQGLVRWATPEPPLDSLACAGLSWHLWGAAGALLTAAISTFCPTLLAHTPLLTSDALAALLLQAVLWSFWTLLHARSIRTVVTATFATGVLRYTRLVLCCLRCLPTRMLP